VCNPRRIEVTATQQVAEAWEREVRRAAEVAGTVDAEARVRQPLDASIGGPALAALEQALEAGFPGWVADGDGWRCDVEGGYVRYTPDDRMLEIVARLSETVVGRAEVVERLSGRVEDTVEATGAGAFHGRGEEKARRLARAEAEAAIADEVRRRIDEAAAEAEAAHDEALRDAATLAAREDLQARASERRAALQAEAAERLEAVGARARQAFHLLLARAYRDALLALARRRGAEDVRVEESDEYVEIEFVLPE
jgi:hypothetical protein